MRSWHKNCILTENLYSCTSSLCRCAQTIPETVSAFAIGKIFNPSSVILQQLLQEQQDNVRDADAAVISHSQAQVSQNHLCWKGHLEIISPRPCSSRDSQSRLSTVTPSWVFSISNDSTMATLTAENHTWGLLEGTKTLQKGHYLFGSPALLCGLLVQEGHCEGPACSCVPYVAIPQTLPESLNCRQQPAVHTKQELLHSKARLYPNQVCRMGQWTTFCAPNSAKLQQLVRF